MDQPGFAAVAPDGNDLYVSAGTSQTVVRFRRDPADGTLTFADVKSIQQNSVTLSPGSLVVSPNSRFVYVAAANNGVVGLACFSRNSTTGVLQQVGLIANDDPTLQGLTSIASVVIAPAGNAIYLLGSNSDSASESIVTIAIDPSTGLMSPTQHLKVTPNIAFPFALSFYQIAISPDARNLYVAAGSQLGVQRFDINADTGLVTFHSLTITGINNPSINQSVSVSPDGAQVYVADSFGGYLTTLTRSPDGTITMPATRDAAPVSFPGITRVIAAPDGGKIYTISYGQLGGSVVRVSAFSRDPISGQPTLLETITDGLSGTPAIQGYGYPTVSADSANF
jgi:6-phosphogluconolactonase (cycloisomerase 2 family)